MSMQMTNLAVGRPATQSSIGDWALGATCETAAAFANNGSRQDGFCHTAREAGAFWQVDLGGIFVVSSLRLHARRSRLERLSKCRIAGSLDGRQWKTMLRKDGDQIESGSLLMNFGAGYPARYVRVTVDYKDYLNFSECEIFGVPFSGLAGHNLAPAMSADASGGARAQIGGFDVFTHPDRYGEKLVNTLMSGRYESHERDLALTLLTPQDRVLEAGTAIGVVSMTAASIVGAANVSTFDANPYIIADARQNFVLNDMPGINAQVGVLANRSSDLLPRGEVAFYVASDFWASRLFASIDDPDIIDVVQVPVRCLEDEIARGGATALICDIEGGEVDLLTRADLSGIRTIIMETHTRRAGVEATNAMMRKLIGQDGFNLDLGRSGSHVVGLQR